MAFQATKRGVKKILRRLGYELLPVNPAHQEPSVHHDPSLNIDDNARKLYVEVQPYTMSTIERVFALREALKYIVNNNIPGSMVKCGVWKGGNMAAIAKTLLRQNKVDRDLYLFDTFAGMTPPMQVDIDYLGRDAATLLDSSLDTKATAHIWAIAPLDEVKQVMQDTGYDPQKIHFVQGRVEDTLPVQAPSQISLLRLDTDWYASTYHEMTNLWPRLSVGGILIIDDYKCWQGARRAIDQYIAENNLRVFLHPIDYTVRICVKIDA